MIAAEYRCCSRGEEESCANNNHQQETVLSKYLESFLTTEHAFPRVECCGNSRSLYCTDCCRLVVPRELCPLPIQNGDLQLPFDLDIVLKDRRKSATGFHAAVLLGTSRANVSKHSIDDAESNPLLYCSEEDCNRGQQRVGQNQLEHRTSNDGQHLRRTVVTLIDLDRDQQIPSYDNRTGTFVLFQSPGISIPISSVVNKISRLIVLDCRWTNSMCQRLPELAHLQKVHLSSPPVNSYFWRWHNEGPGRLSTIEAIYFAALEVFSNDESYPDRWRHALIHIMWLFGIQRSATQISVKKGDRPFVPFSHDGKEFQRAMRRTIKGSEKHLRDKEKGRKLKTEQSRKEARQKKDSTVQI